MQKIKDFIFVRRLKLSIVWIYIGICFVVLNWSIYRWLHFFSVIVYVVPLMLCILLFLAVLSLTKLKHFRIPASIMEVLLFLIVIIGAANYAPNHSVKFAEDLAGKFIRSLDIRVVENEQSIQLLEGIGDLGFPRHVITTYNVLESRILVESKLSQHLLSENGWMFIDNDWGYVCAHAQDSVGNFQHGAHDNQVRISTNNLLLTRLFFDSPARCLLQ